MACVGPSSPPKQTNVMKQMVRDTSSLKALCWEQVTPMGSPYHVTVEEDLLLTLFGNWTPYMLVKIAMLQFQLYSSPYFTKNHVCDLCYLPRIIAEKIIGSDCSRLNKVWAVFTSTTVFRWWVPDAGLACGTTQPGPTRASLLSLCIHTWRILSLYKDVFVYM